MNREVHANGPLDAEILWVGEAPGTEEVRDGKPFVGPSGKVVRSALRNAGFHDEQDVRYANVACINPGMFPEGVAGAKLMLDWAPGLDKVMREMPRLKVIVACGDQALFRLTGYQGIVKWNNSVIHNSDVPDVFTWHKSIKYPAYLPPNVAVIPVLHPAGIMRSKGRDNITLVRRGAHKAKQAIEGKLRTYDIAPILDPNLNTMHGLANRAEWVYFDTEFNGETKEIYWIGLTFDGIVSYGLDWQPEHAKFIDELMRNERILKAAHNLVADEEVLLKVGIPIKGPIWDTMIGMHSLHPALDVGLDDAAKYYLDDIKYWKDMDKRDPRYNAMDVIYGAQVMFAQWDECNARQVNPRSEIEARMKLLRVTAMMTRRGMQIDMPKREQLLTDIAKQITSLEEAISSKVRPLWDERVRDAIRLERSTTEALEELKLQLKCACTAHKYNGRRKPPACPECMAHYEAVAPLRGKYAGLHKQRDLAVTAAKRWSEGYNPGNNEHLRWLLYDALKLPVQRDRSTKKPTAGRAAIDALVNSRYTARFPEAVQLVNNIKEVQHLEKARSTFLFYDETGTSIIDINQTVHPPYKVHGTRTGRLAGGADDDEKSDNKYAFNPLNIPKEWRVMYVPPSGHVFVAADWRNVEGRLTALFCKDPTYNRVLAAELNGGHKVHAVNAGIIYNIDPGDAKKHMIMMGGQPHPAYDAGKRLTHAWSYGMRPMKMANTFGISLKEAVRIDERLSSAYPLLVGWRNQLVVDVLGVWERPLGGHGVICVKPGRRYVANPFGWQNYFMGVGGEQANEVIAFLPQSTGAGMWTRCAPILEERYPLFTGTYDSFVMIVPASAWKEGVEFITKVMQRTWPELGDRSFPCEVSVGHNWGDFHEEKNPQGLKEVA